MKLMDSLRNIAQQVNFKRPATVGRVQRITQLEEAVVRGERIKQMVSTSGWKDLSVEVDARFETLSRELRRTNTWEKAQSLQASLNELDFVRQVVANALDGAVQARQELDTYALED